MRQRLIYRVWSRTSGLVHDAHQIEKRMEEWITAQRREERKKAKVMEWKKRSKSNLNQINIVGKEVEPKPRRQPAVVDKRKLREWQEIRQIKKDLAESETKVHMTEFVL